MRKAVFLITCLYIESTLIPYWYHSLTTRKGDEQEAGVRLKHICVLIKQLAHCGTRTKNSWGCPWASVPAPAVLFPWDLREVDTPVAFDSFNHRCKEQMKFFKDGCREEEEWFKSNKKKILGLKYIFPQLAAHWSVQMASQLFIS